MFKDDIIQVVFSEINGKLKSKVEVAKIDLTFWSTFPNLSVDFEEVFIPDALPNATIRDTFVYSERIRLKFNPIDIWNGNYHVEEVQFAPGTIQLKIDKTGKGNYDIVKESKDTTASKFEFNLDEIELESVRLSYMNQATNQTYAAFVSETKLTGNFSDQRYDLQTEADMLIQKIGSGNVTLLKNQPAKINVAIRVDQSNDVIELQDAQIKIANLPFQVNGKVTKNGYNFEVHSKNISLSDFATNFTANQFKDIKHYQGKGNVFFDLIIRGLKEAQAPIQISCDFGIEKGELIEPEKQIKLTDISLKGTYNNLEGPSKEILKLYGISFHSPGGPFKGNLNLTNFNAPIYDGQANGTINLAMLHSLFQLPHVDKLDGNVDVATTFNIQAIPTQRSEFEYAVNKCDGEITLKNANLKFKEDKRTFEDMNGSLYLRGDEAGIDGVRLKVGKTDLKFNGVFGNITSYLRGAAKLEADVSVSGNYVDVQDLGTTTKEEKIQDSRIFVLPEDIAGNIMIDVKKITYESHEFDNLKGQMLLQGRQLDFPSITLKNAGANVQGSLRIEENYPEIFTIKTQVTANNIAFKPVFKEWNNFEQDVITSANISGRATATIAFEAPFDLRSGIISESIRSEVYLKVTEGRLTNVEAFKEITESLKSPSANLALGKENIANFSRKLMDIKFETLENTFTIAHGKMTLPAMLIHNSAMDVELSGTHTFDNKVDYRFGFSLRDIKGKVKQTEFGEEVDDGTGLKVYMRMYGDLDNPTIVWDKQAKREQLREDIEQEKKDIKSILKTEFGMFKKDTTIGIYEQKKIQGESIKVEFGTSNTPEENDRIEQEKKQKDTKIKKKLKDWKEDAEKDKTEEITFD